MRAIIYLFFFFYLVLGIVRGARMILRPERFPNPRPKASEQAPPSGEAARAQTAEPAAEPPVLTPRQRARIRLAGAVRFAICAFLLTVLDVQFGFLRTLPRVQARSESAAQNQTLVNEAIAKAEAHFQSKNLVGLAVGMVTPEQEAVICLGRESLFGLAPVNENTLFEIGSITKTFTGTLLAKFIEEGKVELDQTVGSLLPKGAEVSDDLRQVTLRQLTTHSAGFPMMPGNFKSPWRIAMILANRDPHASYTEEEFLTALKNLRLEYAPGEKADYSNFSSSFLGYLLAKQAGASYEQVIREEILQPLEMNDTTIRFSPEQEDRVATGYGSTFSLGPLIIARASPPWTLPESFAAAGALRSSISDMMKYLKANMGRGNHPLQAAMDQAQSKLHDGFAGERMAVGMNWLIRQKDGSPEAIWHNGGTGGFRSFLGFSADRQFGVVVLSSSSESVDALGMDLLQFLLKNAGELSPGPQESSPEENEPKPSAAVPGSPGLDPDIRWIQTPPGAPGTDEAVQTPRQSAG